MSYSGLENKTFSLAVLGKAESENCTYRSCSKNHCTTLNSLIFCCLSSAAQNCKCAGTCLNYGNYWGDPVGPSAWDQVAATTLGVRPIITLHRSEVRNWEVQVDTKLKGKLIVKSQKKEGLKYDHKGCSAESAGLLVRSLAPKEKGQSKSREYKIQTAAQTKEQGSEPEIGDDCQAHLQNKKQPKVKDALNLSPIWMQ